jgi:hypothetical protein
MTIAAISSNNDDDGDDEPHPPFVDVCPASANAYARFEKWTIVNASELDGIVGDGVHPISSTWS